MESIGLDKITEWCNGKIFDKKILSKSCKGISVDSRNLKNGDIFIALKGKNFDGHSFIDSAFKKGAVAVIAETQSRLNSAKTIVVRDSLKALGDIAREYRRQFNAYIIGITGSDGKTTTKEFLKKTLSLCYNVKGTEGNLNNEIGLPLSIFNMDGETDFCVLEMGMNKKNEIRYLGKIAEPTAGVITNVASAHSGFFKNGKEIAAAKSELLETLQGEKFCMLNRDNRFFEFFIQKTPAQILSFGIKKGADIRGIIEEEGNDFFVFKIEGTEKKFKVNFWNTSIIYSAMVAYAFARKFEIKQKRIAEVFEEIRPLKGRGNYYNCKDITIIDETYNCNPNSLRASLLSLAGKNFKRKIAVIGDMAELGRYSSAYHRRVGSQAERLDIDSIITFGKESKNICIDAGMKCRHFEEIEPLKTYLSNFIKRGDAILIKGSRFMLMERLTDYLISKYRD